MIAAASTSTIGEVINVGSGREYSVNQLVSLLGGDSVRIPKRPGEPDRTLADISRIHRLLGWTPTVTLHEGVRMMLSHIDRWRDAPIWTPTSIETATRDWSKYLTTRSVSTS